MLFSHRKNLHLLLIPESGSPKNLVTSDVSDSSFRASWTAAPGNVQAYKVHWKSLFSEEQGEKTVPRDVTSTVLDGLTPETRYQVSVVATYGYKDSEPLTGLETTDGKTFCKLLLLQLNRLLCHTLPCLVTFSYS